MEYFYASLISVLLASNVLLGGILVRTYNAAQRKLIEKTNKNELDALMLTKDVNDLYKECDSNKRNIYEMRTTMQVHNDRILILEQNRHKI